jgi:hypothetical protein
LERKGGFNKAALINFLTNAFSRQQQDEQREIGKAKKYFY